MNKFIFIATLSVPVLALAACTPANNDEAPKDEVTAPAETSDTDETGGSDGGSEAPDYNVALTSVEPLTDEQKQELTDRVAKEVASEDKGEDPAPGMGPIVYWDGGRTSLTMRMVERMVAAGVVTVDGCWGFSHPLCP